jgi:hypothetical protein
MVRLLCFAPLAKTIFSTFYVTISIVDRPYTGER